ncbi:unnamed protein product [Bursaphelenchus okinawaensis]|uniref:Nucleoporin NDC1 n=1 Tax=Bursaphelenchus okinawaensis TaxID=465554 RepID=A0A811K3H6_9BILA|nr:unnamed protein product [Bursaphelenchus okinawaensis]CAG9090951.1 unnamed protein product [Bursaphelenchus okinawaensis]
MISPNNSINRFNFRSPRRSPYDHRYNSYDSTGLVGRLSPLDGRVQMPEMLSPRLDYGLTQYYDSNEAPIQLTFSSPQKPVQKFQIQPWFESYLNGRFRWASIASALTSIPIFFLVVLCVQSSLFSPFSSLYNAFMVMFQLQFGGAAILTFLLVFVFSSIMCKYCFGMLYEQNYDVTKEVPLIAAVAITVTSIFFWMFVSYGSMDDAALKASGTIYLFFWTLVLFSAFNTAFASNFRWEFVQETPLKYLNAILVDLLSCTAIDTLRNTLRALVVSSVISLLFSSTRANFFDFLIRPGLMFNHIVIVFGIIVNVRIAFELLNAIVMQPLDLPMPTTTSFISDESAKASKNALNAIVSENLMLKLFGFQSLYDLVSRSEVGRNLVYSISQPAGKPRNWYAVRDSCMESIDYIHGLLAAKVGQVETQPGFEKQKKLAELGPSVRSALTPTVRPMAARVFSGTVTDLGEEKKLAFSTPSKAKLLLPPNLNPRHYEAKKQKAKVFDFSLNSFPLLNKYLTWFKDNFLKPSPAIPTYHLIEAEYALNSLSILLANSLKEDQYGIVQKDLSTLFRAFLQLELAIDLYIRSTSNRKEDVMVRPNLSRLEDVLMESVKRVYLTFGEHIDSLELTPSEKPVLEMMAQNFMNADD